MDKVAKVYAVYTEEVPYSERIINDDAKIHAHQITYKKNDFL